MHTKQKARTIIPMIGDPVAQTASPDQWNKQFAIDGTDTICLPIHLKKEGLAAFVSMVRNTDNIPGFLSTVPHKSEIPSLCEIKSPEVEFLGVANTVRKNSDGSLECTMTDGIGMTCALKSKDCIIKGATILIIGCGAAGSAIAFEALKEGASNIALLDKDVVYAELIAQKLKVAYPDRDISNTISTSRDYSAVINASPQGSQKDDAVPYPLVQFSTHTVIADAITNLSPTRWIKEAQNKGMRTVTGYEMAKAQAQLMKKFIGIG